MSAESDNRKLENQITKLLKQNKILRSNFSIQSEEKVKRADELVTANIELEYQNEEKAKRADELFTANIELEYQSEEKAKRAAELIIANIELVFQNEEKAKRAAELIIFKIKFAQKNKENEKLGEELVLANLAVSLQSDLIAANEEAEHDTIQLRELIATRDKLFSLIAHDLLNPIRNILTLTDLLIESVKANEVVETEKFISFINLSAKKTLVLLENLLNWAKSQTGQINNKPEKIKLSSIIQNVLGASIIQAKIKNISLIYKKPSDIEIYADENMLKTVLRNLISNAIKFTETGGVIKIFTISDQKQVEISICDNGVGMNDSILKRLFDVSASAMSIGTANESGSGLGLVLCKEFVNKLGGNIWAESEEGKGSDFKFTVPLNVS